MVSEMRQTIKRNIKAPNKKAYMKQYHRIYYAENKTGKLEYSADQYLKNRDHLLDLRHQRYLRQRENTFSQDHERYIKTRNELIGLLGGKCLNPFGQHEKSYTDVRCLQIDHVNGGGRTEVKKFPNTLAFYKYVIEQVKSGSKNYQLLCANCNLIKRNEKREFRKRVIV
jgi:hypothetical protein